MPDTAYDPKRDLKVRYTHDAMVDLIIANPGISQDQLAAEFGYTPSWVSMVVNSDAFQLRLSQRKEELIDPILRLSIEERMKAVTNGLLDAINDKLAAKNVTMDEAAKVLSITTRALGYGVRQPDQKVDVTQYVAFLPPQAQSADAWATAHRPTEAPVIEMSLPNAIRTMSAVEVGGESGADAPTNDASETRPSDE